MGSAHKYPTARSLGTLSPITRIDTPYEHALALWPGLADGNPFGNKSVLRDFSDSEWGLRSKSSRLGLVRRVPEEQPEYKTRVDDLLYVRRGGTADEATGDLSSVVDYLKGLQGQQDKYISLNTFYGRRQHSHLKCLTALVVDLDLSKAAERSNDYAGDFMRMRQDALDAISNAGVPTPNFSVQTGKGVHLYWLFDRILPAKAFARWQACQKALIQLLKSVGADEAIKDSARVLRLVGTMNSTAPVYCARVTSQIFTPDRYNFDFLADQVLPITRQDLDQLRAARADKIKEIGIKQAAAGAVVKPAPGARRGRRFSATAIGRLADLGRLATDLYPDGIPEGSRDKYLFAATCNLAWICRRETLETEVLAWKARHVPSMQDKEALSMMGSAIRRAHAAYSINEGKAFENIFDDERYVHSAEALWNSFGDDIQRAGLVDQMQLILPAGVLKERRRAARRAQRPDNYTGLGIRTSNIRTALEAHALRAGGATLREISEQLGFAAKTILAWLEIDQVDLATAPTGTGDTNRAPAAAAVPEIPAVSPPPRPPSYPQAPVDQGVLPKSNLKNGEATQFLETSSLMGVAQGDPSHQQSFDVQAAVPKIPDQHDVPVPPPVQEASPAALDVQRGEQKPLFDAHGPGAVPAGLDTVKFLPATGRRRKYPIELLEQPRELEAPAVLDRLGLHFKVDAAYVPKRSGRSARIHVTLESGQVIELVFTGPKWFDKRAKVGAYGGIDLVMHLLDMDFHQAVEVLKLEVGERRNDASS